MFANQVLEIENDKEGWDTRSSWKVILGPKNLELGEAILQIKV